MATSERPFFGRIESLRGLGALAVALVHFGQHHWQGVSLLPTIGTSQPLANYFPGHAALMMFFVISGFVLRLTLAHGPQTPGASTASFLVKRFWRVYPIVVVALLLTLWYDGGLITTYNNPRPLRPGEWWRNLLLLEATINPAFWALQVEVLMVPIILALYWAERRWSAKIVLLSAWLLTPLTFSHGLAGYAFAVVLGLTVPTYGRAFVVSLSRRRLFVLLSIALLLMEFMTPWCGLFSPWTRLVEGYAGWFVVSVVAYRLDVRSLRVLDLRTLRWLGRLSGSFYVLHMLLGEVFLSHVSPRVLFHCGPLGLLAALLFAVGVSWLAFVLVEAPSMALGKRMARWTTRTAAPAPSASRVAVPA